MIVIFIIAALICALQSIRASTLLIASLWLGGVSIAVAVSLYMVGAREIAVIELSVSAGLVMVLLVFAITVLGDSTPHMTRMHMTYVVVVSTVILSLMFLTIPELHQQPANDPGQLAAVLWHERALDTVLQLTLLFAGSVTVLSLLRLPLADEEDIGDNIAEIEKDQLTDPPPVISEPQVELELKKELL